jgi:hypothetical protein
MAAYGGRAANVIAGVAWRGTPLSLAASDIEESAGDERGLVACEP